MKKLKFQIIDKHTVELKEKGEIGDIIDFHDQIELEISPLSEFINKHIHEESLKARSDQKEKDRQEYENILNKKIEESKKQTLIEFKNLKNEEINQINLQHLKQIEKLQIENNKQLEVERNKNNELINNINTLKEQNVDLNIQIKNLWNEHEQKNIKNIGENLEQWCYDEFQKIKSVGGFHNCELFKDTISVATESSPNKTKSDFIFKVYDNNDLKKAKPLVSICCEMKTELYNSRNKKKFDEMQDLQKLHEDRIKKNCEIALMITEREQSNGIIYKKCDDFDDMYIIRPHIFTGFLYIFASLYQKQANELKNFKNMKLAFEEKHADAKELHERLNWLRENVQTQLDSLSKNSKEAFEEAEKIIRSAEKIKNLTQAKINRSIEKISKNIINFKLTNQD